MPLNLKVLNILLGLWVAMTIAVTVSMPDREIAFYGLILVGFPGLAVVIVLDILCPAIFIVSTIKRRRWGAKFGLTYNAVFLVNCLVSLWLFSDIFGNGVYFPFVMSILFLVLIYKERAYFSSPNLESKSSY